MVKLPDFFMQMYNCPSTSEIMNCTEIQQHVKSYDVAEDTICLFNATLLPVEQLYDILGIWEPILEKQTVQIALRTMSGTLLIVWRA